MMFGYNVLNIPDKAVLLSHMHRLNPPAMLFFQNEIEFARQVKVEFPDMIVIIRHWPDSDVYKQMSPQQWMRNYADHAEGGLYLQTTNESGLSQEVINWHLELMDLAIARGVHLVLLNPATGTWDTPDYVRLAPLLRKAGEHRDLFIIGLHSYAGGVITSGVGGGYPGNAAIASSANDAPGTKGRNLIPRENWPSKETIYKNRWTTFHIGRHKWILDYCTDNNIPKPRFALTETGFDYLGDIGPWLNTLQKNVYNNINGWQTLRAQWVTWWGGYSDEDYTIQLKYAAENLLQGLDFALIYAYGDDGNWPSYRVDQSDIPNLLERLTPVLPPPPVVTPPPPADVDAEEWIQDGMHFTEILRKEYSGNNCVFSAGTVEGATPSIDKFYLKWHKDGADKAQYMLLLTADELQAISWVASGAIMEYLLNQRIKDA